MKILAVVLTAFLLCTQVAAQTKKNIDILPISTPLVLDGILDEPVYQQQTPAKDFVQLQPYNGKPSFQPSEAYFFYDQTAIYVGAMLYDSAPDSIFNFLTERDNIGMSDYFGVYLDPYNQGQLAYGFFITPAGVQTDIKAVKRDYDNEDGNWNAVWESRTYISDKGWSVEMRIPFSALRFSEKAGTTWGLNMFRNIRRYNSNNSWNFVDRNVDGFIHQEGQMAGMKNISPPVRLSFSPYAATYLETKKGFSSPEFIYKGGLDLKYGINESFTLDMMLIPDFGQIQSDDKKLNLTPYELYYDEKRQFFNEGTELFQRGNIFYSRRIGSKPIFSASDFKGENEIVSYNPTETQLVNATKISGRTNNDWGIGFLNAMSLPSNATLKDTITGKERDIKVQPFTNYNVSVVDKSLKNNSYVSFINSNISMADNSFLANVTATEFQLRDKSKSYALKGKGGVSARGEDAKEQGYYTSLGLERNKGKLQVGITEFIFSDKYNPNDLGYLQRNNQMRTEGWIYYQHIEPFWVIREYNGNVWCDYTRMYKPNTFFNTSTGFNFNANFTNNYYINLNGGYSSRTFDYYEPRVKGRYYLNPNYYWYNVNINTDSRKNLNFYFHLGRSEQSKTDNYANFGDFNSNLRIGQRFQVKYGFSFNFSYNEKGYVDKNNAEDSIYFAKRNVKTWINVLSSSYVINNKMGLSFRMRHYWSGAKNDRFYLLQNDGSLLHDPFYVKNQDKNSNYFTVDMTFRWIFRPGSELVFAWKSSASEELDRVNRNYWNNFQNSYANMANSLSLKVLYYIDYNNIKRKAPKTQDTE